MGIAWRVLRNQEEARDIYQETFLRFHTAWSKGEEITHPKAWLCRIALNMACSRGDGKGCSTGLAVTEQIREDHPPDGLLEEAGEGLLERIENLEQPVRERRRIPFLERLHPLRFLRPAYVLGKRLRPAYVVGLAAVIVAVAVFFLNDSAQMKPVYQRSGWYDPGDRGGFHPPLARLIYTGQTGPKDDYIVRGYPGCAPSGSKIIVRYPERNSRDSSGRKHRISRWIASMVGGQYVFSP
jgi:hypothetical protein